MKSEFVLPLAIAILLGATGCDKPDSLADWTEPEPEPEIVSAEILAPAGETAVTEIEVTAPAAETTEPSAREKILAVRAGTIGKTRQDLAIKGTPLGEATIVSIDDSGVRLRHRAGDTDLSWADLPAPLKDAWGYDPIGAALFSANPSSDAPKLAVIDPESVAPNAPQPIAGVTATALDPRTQARELELQSQIAKLSENLKNARETVKEAQVFHGELAVIYAAQEKKEAAEKAARVYERMRASSCSS